MERSVILTAGDAAVTCVWLRYAAIPTVEALPRTVLAGDQVEEDARALRSVASALAMATMKVPRGPDCSAILSENEISAFHRLIERCRPVWRRQTRGWIWYPFPVPSETLRVAVAMADETPLKRRWRQPMRVTEPEEAAIGEMAEDRRWLARLTETQRIEVMESSWMMGLSERE